MDTHEVDEIGKVISANRFYIKSEAIRKLADHFEKVVPGFRRTNWYTVIDGKPREKPGTESTPAPGTTTPGSE